MRASVRELGLVDTIKFFIEHRIDGAIGNRLEPALVARAAVQLQRSTPALDVAHGKPINAKRLVDEIARRMRGVLARRDAKRNALGFDVGERFDAGTRMHREDEGARGDAAPGR